MVHLFFRDTAAFLADPDALTGSTPIIMQGMIEADFGVFTREPQTTPMV